MGACSEGKHICTIWENIFILPAVLKNYGGMWLIIQKGMKITTSNASTFSSVRILSRLSTVCWLLSFCKATTASMMVIWSCGSPVHLFFRSHQWPGCSERGAFPALLQSAPESTRPRETFGLRYCLYRHKPEVTLFLFSLPNGGVCILGFKCSVLGT